MNASTGPPVYGLGESWRSLNTLAHYLHYLQKICGLNDGLLEQALKGAVAAVAAEREACAKLVREHLQYESQRAVSWHEVEDCIAAIRARGSNGPR